MEQHIRSRLPPALSKTQLDCRDLRRESPPIRRFHPPQNGTGFACGIQQTNNGFRATQHLQTMEPTLRAMKRIIYSKFIRPTTLHFIPKKNGANTILS